MKNFRMTTTGRFLTHNTLWVLESLSLAPKGTLKVSAMLQVGADYLVESGKIGIFTPMFRCVTRKPVQ